MSMEQKCANCGNGKWRDGVTAITDTCTTCHYVDKEGRPQPPSNWKPKVQTNADRIRAMSDEELAKVIICPKQVCDDVHILVGRTDCEACSLEWLQQPAEGE